MLFIQKHIKQFFELQNFLTNCLKNIVAQQTKYYNKKYKSKSFAIKKLIIFSTKNLK